MASGSSYSTSQIQSMITSAATQYGVDPALALAVAQQESGFNPNALSPTNSNGTQDYGVFQINSSNLASLGLTSNPLDPQANINAGVSMLAQLLNQYNGDVQTALWAYNAGPGNVANGVLPSSTASYISAVTAAIPGFGGTVPVDLTSASDSGVLDLSDLSSDDSVSLFGESIPLGYVIGGALALFGLLAYTLSD